MAPTNESATSESAQGTGRRPQPVEWRILGGVGLCLVVAGTAELVLGLMPYSFGEPDWEYGSVSDFLNRLPLAGLGLMLVLAAALRRGFSRRALVWSLALLLLGVVVFVFGLLYATSLPVIWAAQGQGPMRVQILKGIAKSAAQTGVYTLAFIGVAVYGIFSARRIRAA